MPDPAGLLAALIGAVEASRVEALLLERAPSLLDSEQAEDHARYTELLEGVATEILPLLRGVTTGQRWQLGVWAVETGVAARIEAALPPQDGDSEQTGLSRSLDRSFASLKAQLAGSLEGDPGPASARPRGRFPAAPGYPDAADRVAPTVPPYLSSW